MSAFSIAPKLSADDASWPQFSRGWRSFIVVHDFRLEGNNAAARLADKRRKMFAILSFQTMDNLSAQEQLSQMQIAGTEDGEAAFIALNTFFTPQQAAFGNAKIMQLEAKVVEVFVEKSPTKMLHKLVEVEVLYNETSRLNVRPDHAPMIAKFLGAMNSHCEAELVAYKVQWRQNVNDGTITEFRQLMNAARVTFQTMIAENGLSMIKRSG